MTDMPTPPAGQCVEPEIERPLIRLDLYPSVVMMTRYVGQAVSVYPVSALDVAAAWTKLSVSSGFLPANALFWRQQGESVALGVYVPARQWTVRSAAGSLRLPFPPLVFVGQERQYSVFAVKRRPRDQWAALYHAPFPNVWPDGRICAGNVPFPDCSPQNVDRALTLFLEGSRFNRDLVAGKCHAYPDDVYRLWTELAGRRRFPLLQLVPMRWSLADIMR